MDLRDFKKVFLLLLVFIFVISFSYAEVFTIVPDNNCVLNSTESINFYFIIKSNLPSRITYSCDLYINNINKLTKSNFFEDEMNFFTIENNLENGNYDWYINCSGNVSESKSFTISCNKILILF